MGNGHMGSRLCCPGGKLYSEIRIELLGYICREREQQFMGVNSLVA